MTILIADGACSGNPGQGGIAVGKINDLTNQVTVTSRCIGNTTNNKAEFEAIKLAIELCHADPNNDYIIVSDSKLAVDALYGRNRLKNQDLCKLTYEIVEQTHGLASVELRHVSEIANDTITEAHALVDKAAKKQSKKTVPRQAVIGSNKH